MKEDDMATKAGFLGTVVLGCLAAMLVGCSGATHHTGEGFSEIMKEAPPWARKGCAAFSGEKKKWICGVGSMSGTNNLSLCRSMGMARGRTEIARELSLRVKAMIKDYQRTVTGGGAMGKAADDEQYAVDVAKQITDVSLPGTRLEDSWVSDKGDCFALVVLDTEGFTGALQAAAGLDTAVKDYVIKNAEKAFAELDAVTPPPTPPAPPAPAPNP
jgi:hypothetical protein